LYLYALSINILNKKDKKMKSILAIFGTVALIDYVADGEFDYARHSITETRDAIATTWNFGERQIKRGINALN